MAVFLCDWVNLHQSEYLCDADSHCCPTNLYIYPLGPHCHQYDCQPGRIQCGSRKMQTYCGCLESFTWDMSEPIHHYYFDICCFRSQYPYRLECRHHSCLYSVERSDAPEAEVYDWWRFGDWCLVGCPVSFSSLHALPATGFNPWVFANNWYLRASVATIIRMPYSGAYSAKVNQLRKSTFLFKRVSVSLSLWCALLMVS